MPGDRCTPYVGFVHFVFSWLLLRGAEVAERELGGGAAPIRVAADRVANIEPVPGSYSDVDDFRTSAPGNGFERALAGANRKLEVILPDFARVADDLDAERGKERGGVVRAEWLELLKRSDKGVVNLLNRRDRVDV